MEFNIAVCEDCTDDALLLSGLLQADEDIALKKPEISLFTSGEKLLESFTYGSYNLIFLDVYMGELSGVETARRLREIDQDVLLVFVTSSLDNALAGFDVNALHYIVKPATTEDVHQVAMRCRHFWGDNDRVIELMVNRTQIKVPIRTILYAEVYAKVSTVHCQGDCVLRTYMTMEEMENMLADTSFLRCHRSYLVNMRYIKEVSDTSFILLSGEEIPIRQKDRKAIKEKFYNYLLQQMKNGNII